MQINVTSPPMTCGWRTPSVWDLHENDYLYFVIPHARKEFFIRFRIFTNVLRFIFNERLNVLVRFLISLLRKQSVLTSNILISKCYPITVIEKYNKNIEYKNSLQITKKKKNISHPFCIVSYSISRSSATDIRTEQ